ncbi:hypothetical protein GCM10020367_38460 [Streptomyces sannanensis]|uniref:L,D-transpeptidase n=1 Tax=Streptomyces sannanensis TaxID=285536 RepID=A0ABP6SE56_9ACTN
MAGLTAVSLAAVGFLAYQASANAPSSVELAERRPSATGSGGDEPRRNPLSIPRNSGMGLRVVYSPNAKRVWLINERGRAKRTFPVVPGTATPKPGTYWVTSRTGYTTGTDGVRVEHVVRFAKADEVTVGFSAAVDGSLPAPDPKKKTGGVRMARADGDAMWSFATISTIVVVVP